MGSWSLSKRRRRSAAVACVAAALASLLIQHPAGAAVTSSRAATASDTWPMFGHDPLHSGISPDTAITSSTAPGMTMRWSRSLASTIDSSSPAVAYNATLKEMIVYDVTYTGVMSAFNASTGALIWQRSVGARVPSSPAVYGNTVYFGDLSGTLEALNAATGSVQCTFTLPVIPPDTKPGRLISSPVVGDIDGRGPTVFIGDAGPPSTNELENGGHFWAITGVGNTAGKCREKWVYNNWPNKGKNGTMTGVWDEPALAQDSNGTWAVVFGTSNPDGAVYALNAASGARLWRFQTLQTAPDQDVGAGPTISPPGGNGFAQGAVYIEGKDDIEYALNLLTGKQIWSFNLAAATGTQDNAVSVAALTGNTLVLGYGGSVFALKATTGATIWRATPGGAILASPAVSGTTGGQVLFIGDLNDHEYGLSLQNGALLFAALTKGQINASAAVANGMLYFPSDGTLYAYAP